MISYSLVGGYIYVKINTLDILDIYSMFYEDDTLKSLVKIKYYKINWNE